MDAQELETAHKHSIYNKDEILVSSICGCFYCCKIYSPSEITQWIHETRGQGKMAACPYTAICPRCGIDSVIGSASGCEITESILKKMHDHWFSISED